MTTYTNAFYWAITNFAAAGLLLVVFLVTAFYTWTGWMVTESHSYTKLTEMELEQNENLESAAKKKHKKQRRTQHHQADDALSHPSLETVDLSIHRPAHDPESGSHLHGRHIFESEQELLRLTFMSVGLVFYSISNKPATLDEAGFAIECSAYDPNLFLSNAVVVMLAVFTFVNYMAPLFLGPTGAPSDPDEGVLQRAGHAYRIYFKTWEFFYTSTVLGVSFIGAAVISLIGRQHQIPRVCSEEGVIQSHATFAFYIVLSTLSLAAAVVAVWIGFQLQTWHALIHDPKRGKFLTWLFQVLDVHYFSVWVALGVNLVFFLGVLLIFTLECARYYIVVVNLNALPSHFPSAGILAYCQDGLYLGWILYHGVVYFKGLDYERKRWQAKVDNQQEMVEPVVRNLITGQSLLEWMIEHAHNTGKDVHVSESEILDLPTPSMSTPGGRENDDVGSDNDEDADINLDELKTPPKQQDSTYSNRPNNQAGNMHAEGERIDGDDNNNGHMHDDSEDCSEDCCRCNNSSDEGVGACVSRLVFGVHEPCGRKHCRAGS